MVFWLLGGLLLRKCDSYFFHDSQGSFLQKITNNETTRICFFQGNIDVEFLRCKTPHGGFSSLLCDRWPEGRVRIYFHSITSINVLFPILLHTLGFQTSCFWRYDRTPKNHQNPTQMTFYLSRYDWTTRDIHLFVTMELDFRIVDVFSKHWSALCCASSPWQNRIWKRNDKTQHCERRNPLQLKRVPQCHALYQSLYIFIYK